MNKKRRQKLLIILTMLVLCLSACSSKSETSSDAPKKHTSDTNNEKEDLTTPTEEDVAIEETEEEATHPQKPESTVVGTWTIDDQKFYDKNNEGQLGIAYGTGISYGYEMTFSEDGSFSYNIGITSNGEGTYIQDGDQIVVNITSAWFDEYLGTYTYKIVEEDGRTYIVMNDLEYVVYWYQE